MRTPRTTSLPVPGKLINKSSSKSPSPAPSVDGRFNGNESPLTITIKVESPPLISYGPPAESTGALLSGILNINNIHAEKTFTALNFTMKLVLETTVSRPVSEKCKQCAKQTETIHEWFFIGLPRRIPPGRTGFPFSYLFSGKLPASIFCKLATISYKLVVTLKAEEISTVVFERPITLSRSILPGKTKLSQRIFPPTTLVATAKLPNVVYPHQIDLPIMLSIQGLALTKGTHWEIRKIHWRLNELSFARSPACPNHKNKLTSKTSPTDILGIQNQDVKVLTCGELRSGWNIETAADETGIEKAWASVTIVIDIASASCDVDNGNGIKVTHALLVEIIVGEEVWNPSLGNKSKGNWQATGIARVLRMSFNLVGYLLLSAFCLYIYIYIYIYWMKIII